MGGPSIVLNDLNVNNTINTVCEAKGLMLNLPEKLFNKINQPFDHNIVGFS